MKDWYILYEGSSPDGRGCPTFKRRTYSERIAREFYDKHKDDPYFTGHVDIYTGTKAARRMTDER